ncbi:hypothetical protein [Cypionkella sp.]|uniref:hypothetical protein n=1 Tax=Cypionkella sp. TaxID=2811411 RepID=UPI00271E508F|nr:hypothetical protein [Cypionkella sp.]MDO8982998.1 hypothetical protein [Cypionkella sp.]
MIEDPWHPIVTVQLSGSITAQGPTVEEADVRRQSLPTDMHGKLAVRTGENTVAVGRPIQKMRKPS